MPKPLQVNWSAMKADYVEHGMSLSDIAKRYAINRNTLGNHAKRYKWNDDRLKRRYNPYLTEPLETFSSDDLANKDPVELIQEQCLRIVRSGLDKIESGMLALNPKDAQGIRQYTTSLRDLQAVAGAYNGLTAKEMIARIENLIKGKTGDEDGDTGVVVIPAVEIPGETAPTPSEDTPDGYSDDE